ncbi:short chain enoyl-CoA hydratase / 3-hydroxyacyl-CoA dehydrogenase [Magnetococcus marinus MC-1]|uniref:enoyl-CoA hydratase n=1 Tax=Magnetococcus marinus (strain ATCC BAA-1437 / JCM 17883 / MC-1) TaxID=156889 RepID=A0LDJ8_MAGMM|nr:3-hydroxyacyl-CoA dehydrogenase NAD-binding domain-containing protein [Magnetococcus marinus]ABK46041.1 short chain enoyl-CoA hydratase / 3-hydroxyacyl-CoA dehydrogenase [Magnetococcus marinus MC-1]
MKTPSCVGYYWHWERDDAGVVWLTADQPERSANLLSRGVLEELNTLLLQLEKWAPAALVIQSAKPAGFFAGADIQSFAEMQHLHEAQALIAAGQRVMDRLAQTPYPTLALIHGHCMGGGLELALSCDYRIACQDGNTRIGLPEVQLGIFPAWGGTWRLTRAIGELPAMQMMLNGQLLHPKQALQLGVVHELSPQRLMVRAARDMLSHPPKARRRSLLDRLLSRPTWRWVAAAVMTRQVNKKAPLEHYPAPHALLKHWRLNMADHGQAMLGEQQAVAPLMGSHTTQQLVRLFHLKDRLKGLAKTADGAIPRHVHVVGDGVMGRAIAVWCALQGMQVSLQGLSTELLGRALQEATQLARKKRLDRLATRDLLDRLMPDQRGDGVCHADLVIEAIFEDVTAKQQLYAALEPRMREHALLATNTSAIPLQTLAQGLKRPQQLLGLHFFNPVARMPLVEVVEGPQTSMQALQMGYRFVHAIQRLPLPVKSRPGFLVNRVLMPYLMEAVRMVDEGVDMRRIDKAAMDFGMPMGPLALADAVGLDVCKAVARELVGSVGGGVPQRLLELVSAGQLGRKSGAGFYRYGRGRAKPGSRGRAFMEERDITYRLILPMLNEAAAILQEGVVADADLVDAGMVFGTGFAPFRGGPMAYAARTGEVSIIALFKELEAHFGSRFAPHSGWMAPSLRRWLQEREARHVDASWHRSDTVTANTHPTGPVPHTL